MNSLTKHITVILSGFLIAGCTLIEPEWYTYMEKARESCKNGDFSQTEECVKRALSSVKQGKNPSPYGIAPYTPTTLSGQLATLADCYAWWGKYDRAEALCNQAIALSPEGEYESELANIYRKQSKYSEAEPLLRKLVGVAEKSYVQKNDHTLYWMPLVYNLFDLGDCYAAQNKLADAEALYKRGLGELEQAEPRSGFLAARLVQVGQFYFRQGKLIHAKTCFERALSIQEHLPDPNGQIFTAHEKSCLADVYAAQRNFRNAEALYKESLQSYYSFPTEEEIATRLNYATLLKRLRRFSEAQTMESIAKNRQSVLSKEQTELSKIYAPAISQ